METVQRLGEAALSIGASPPAHFEVQRRVWQIARAARLWPGVTDVVPGMNNITLFFEPECTDVPLLEESLQNAWNACMVIDSDETQRVVEISVVYGGEQGPDLSFVAEHSGLSECEVIKLHSSPEYVVYFLGFKPGFAYLGNLDKRLWTPRRTQPRSDVPAGSVGIGGEQTAIYPFRSPGGWQLIGRTDHVLFDPLRAPAAALTPGDRVRFVPTKP